MSRKTSALFSAFFAVLLIAALAFAGGAGAKTETEQKVEQLVRFVREAGRTPVQRDTLYKELRRW